MVKSLFFITLLSFGSLAQALPILSLTPNSANVGQSEQFNIDVSISGLTDFTAPALASYDIDIQFDNSILSFVGGSILSQLDLGIFGSFEDIQQTGSNNINLNGVSFEDSGDLDALQTDEFTIATLTFDAIDIGVADVLFSFVDLGDSLAQTISFEQFGSQISVTDGNPVPLPATAWMLLLALAGIRWKRQAS